MLRSTRRAAIVVRVAGSVLALVLGAFGCEATMAGIGPGGAASAGGPWVGPRPVCPMDPDCNIGGDCSLHECPDHWDCQPTSGGGAQCANPGPDYPDDRGDWSCRDESGATICVRDGGDVPAGAGGDGWSCERMGESIVCRDGTPSYPGDYPGLPGDGPWSCRFDEGLRVCSRGATPGDGGGGGWACTTSTAGTECRQSMPGTPDGSGEWTCYEVLGTVACTRGSDSPGGDPPGGGGWDCEEERGHVTCSDSRPDYPDGGGSGVWQCRYGENAERICASETPRPGAGSPPAGDGPPGTPSAPPSAPGSPPGDLPPEGAPPTSRECARGDTSCDVAACATGGRSTASFVDDLDGAADGEIVVFSDRSPAVACATVRVERTGWYRIHDRSLAESCGQQRDETAFITITNSCRAGGQPLEHNAGDRFVWQDLDNRACASDAECGAGLACQAPRHGARTCCSPDSPVFMGTFLLRAGESNRLCLHHWCPVWQSEGRSGGFVHNDCRDALNSVHFRLDDSAIVCGEDLSVPPECR